MSRLACICSAFRTCGTPGSEVRIPETLFVLATMHGARATVVYEGAAWRNRPTQMQTIGTHLERDLGDWTGVRNEPFVPEKTPTSSYASLTVAMIWLVGNSRADNNSPPPSKLGFASNSPL